MRAPSFSSPYYETEKKDKYINNYKYSNKRLIVNSSSDDHNLAFYKDYSSNQVPGFRDSSMNCPPDKQHSFKLSSNPPIDRKLRESEDKIGPDFEKLYYLELEKNKNLQKQVSHLENAQNRLHSDKTEIKRYYEDFIEQLKTDLSNAKSFELSTTELDKRNRALETELHKTRIELKMLKNVNENGSDAALNDLRKRIRVLNDEKMKILNTLDVKQIEVNKLNSMLENFQTKNNDFKEKNLFELRNVKHQLELKDKDLENFRRDLVQKEKQTFVIKVRDAEIDDLTSEISNLKRTISRLRQDITNKDDEIYDLRSKPRYTERINHVPKNDQLPVKIQKIESRSTYNQSPKNNISYIQEAPSITRILSPTRSYSNTPVERISVVREPANVKGVISRSPSIVRTVSPSPIVNRQHVDARSNCGECNRRDQCLKPATYTTFNNDISAVFNQPMSYVGNVYRPEYGSNPGNYGAPPQYGNSYPVQAVNRERFPADPSYRNNHNVSTLPNDYKSVFINLNSDVESPPRLPSKSDVKYVPSLSSIHKYDVSFSDSSPRNSNQRKTYDIDTQNLNNTGDQNPSKLAYFKSKKSDDLVLKPKPVLLDNNRSYKPIRINNDKSGVDDQPGIRDTQITYGDLSK